MMVLKVVVIMKVMRWWWRNVGGVGDEMVVVM